MYFGTYQPALFTTQLETLDRMRTLPEKLSSQNLLHIDLTQPSAPVLEMKLTQNNKSNPTNQQATPNQP